MVKIIYDRTIGDNHVSVREEATRDPDYQWAVEVHGLDINRGPGVRLCMSLEELRDLHYMIGRAIARVNDLTIQDRMAKGFVTQPPEDQPK